MHPPSVEALLAVWERGRHCHPVDRAVLLHSLAAPEAEPDSLPDEPVGRRNAALLQLRVATFGNRLRGLVDCPQCGTRLECELDAATLLGLPPGNHRMVQVDGLVFRQPTTRDLAAIVAADRPAVGALRLLQHCVVPLGEHLGDSLLEGLRDRVEAALEQADPWANLAFDLRCDVCGQAWSSSFDIAGFLWEEVEAYAERVLDDVHRLARAYGWSEDAILALSDARRDAYLERVAT
jgi:hypothetical protein